VADDRTLDFYARNAAQYVQHGAESPNSHLLSFVAALPANARVLELGSGSGRDSAFMLSQGVDIYPSDASPHLAREAERRIGRPVRLLRFSELAEVGIYDGIWASASLLHAPASELSDDLARIHRALRPSGLFVASFEAGAGEGRDEFGRYYNYTDADTLLAHYRTATQWASLRIETNMGSGYGGKPTQWHWVTARR
jgi:SAM-dependent methyltransferase